LLIGHLVCALRQVIELACRLILTHSAKQVLGILQAFGGAPSACFALVGRTCGIPHVVQGPIQLIEGLLQPLIRCGLRTRRKAAR
jgi:hypothetical protein